MGATKYSGGVRREVSVFSPPGDLRGINQALSVPIGMRVTDFTLLRMVVGIVSSANTDECRAGVKVYATAE